MIYLILSPYDNEQSDLVARVSEEPRLADVPLFKALLKNFTTQEIMLWSKVRKSCRGCWHHGLIIIAALPTLGLAMAVYFQTKSAL